MLDGFGEERRGQLVLPSARVSVRQQARGAVPDAAVPDASVLDGDVLAAAAATVSAEDDPELAAYNARLSALAAQGPKTWRRREPVVVRTPGAPAPSGQQR